MKFGFVLYLSVPVTALCEAWECISLVIFTDLCEVWECISLVIFTDLHVHHYVTLELCILRLSGES